MLELTCKSSQHILIPRGFCRQGRKPLLYADLMKILRACLLQYGSFLWGASRAGHQFPGAV